MVFAGYFSFLHQLQLASHELPGIWQKKWPNSEIPNSIFKAIFQKYFLFFACHMSLFLNSLAGLVMSNDAFTSSWWVFEVCAPYPDPSFSKYPISPCDDESFPFTSWWWLFEIFAPYTKRNFLQQPFSTLVLMTNNLRLLLGDDFLRYLLHTLNVASYNIPHL